MSDETKFKINILIGISFIGLVITIFYGMKTTPA
jgi:hypothetical protein